MRKLNVILMAGFLLMAIAGMSFADTPYSGMQTVNEPADGAGADMQGYGFLPGNMMGPAQIYGSSSVAQTSGVSYVNPVYPTETTGNVSQMSVTPYGNIQPGQTYGMPVSGNQVPGAPYTDAQSGQSYEYSPYGTTQPDQTYGVPMPGVQNSGTAYGTTQPGQDYASSAYGTAYGMQQTEQAYGVPAGGTAYGMQQTEQAYGVPAAGAAYGMPQTEQAYGVPAGGTAYGMPQTEQVYGVPAGGTAYGIPQTEQAYGVPAAGAAYGMPQQNQVTDTSANNPYGTLPASMTPYENGQGEMPVYDSVQTEYGQPAADQSQNPAVTNSAGTNANRHISAEDAAWLAQVYGVSEGEVSSLPSVYSSKTENSAYLPQSGPAAAATSQNESVPPMSPPAQANGLTTGSGTESVMPDRMSVNTGVQNSGIVAVPQTGTYLDGTVLGVGSEITIALSDRSTIVVSPEICSAVSGGTIGNGFACRVFYERVRQGVNMYMDRFTQVLVYPQSNNAGNNLTMNSPNKSSDFGTNSIRNPAEAVPGYINDAYANLSGTENGSAVYDD